MKEIIVNLHMHTTYSDGHGSHADILQAAQRAGIDAVIVTDHNVLVKGLEGYYSINGQRVLLLVGEEVHDQARQPQKNHLMVIGADRELSTLAFDPQRLVEGVRQAGGLSFIAHPVDPASPAIGEDDLSWNDWQVQGFNGLELWNGMSEFKSLIKKRWQAFYYAFNPAQVAHGPLPETIKKWDELLMAGKRIVAIGGTDAHALPARAGFIRRVLYPYEFHFKTINTHIILPAELPGNFNDDKTMLLKALANGCAFIGYDLPAPTKGFRFTAQGRDQVVRMGAEVSAQSGVTIQIRLPRPVECRLIKDGKMIKTWQNRDTCTHITNERGVYRVEAYIEYKGKRRGWIFSNPIYVVN